MASEDDDEIKRKDEVFYKVLSRPAALYVKTRPPSPVLIAAAKKLLQEGFHPFDTVKMLSTGPTHGMEAAAVYAALGISPEHIVEGDKWKK